MRRHLIAATTVLALATPLGAQDDSAPDETDGLSLMERGARLLMEGLRKEMEPALEGLEDLAPKFRSFAMEMGPALRDLMEEVEDWSIYHPPEKLPNGDIIIRRKTPEDDSKTPEDGEQIDI